MSTHLDSRGSESKSDATAISGPSVTSLRKKVSQGRVPPQKHTHATLLSHAAFAVYYPSGMNATCEICRWWHVRRVGGFSFPTRPTGTPAASNNGEREGKSDHKKSAWSSEPVISSSMVATSALHHSNASSWVNGSRQRGCLLVQPDSHAREEISTTIFQGLMCSFDVADVPGWSYPVSLSRATDRETHLRCPNSSFSLNGRTGQCAARSRC